MQRRCTPFALGEPEFREVELKLRSLLEVCQIYKVPMFASVAVSNNEEETVYNNIVYNAPSHDMKLADDRIRKYMLIADGFDAVPPRDVLTMDMESFSNDDAGREDGNGK